MSAFDDASARRQDDEACGRLLEIYVQQAEQYDKGLVQSWKDDMPVDVTLVFSGLYSAVLTAFVIESYQRLQEDPADSSVALLQHISDQLVAFSNSSIIIAEEAKDEFRPTPAAVACNVLWFLSLLLAICCAFLATFVQQWSRQFMHKTSRLRSSTAHARLFSFLYFGLKNEYLLRDLQPDSLFSHALLYSYSTSADASIVPQLDTKHLLPQERMTRFDVILGIILRLPELPQGDEALMLKFICRRAEHNGWGSTRSVWKQCTTMEPLTICGVDKDSCNGMREGIYAQLPPSLDYTQYSAPEMERIWPACVCILDRHTSPRWPGGDLDTPQIALETMLSMRVVIVDQPQEIPENHENFKLAREYVQQNVLRLGERSWNCDDLFFGDNVKASRVIILTTRLLERYLALPDDSIGTNDIVDALEFVLHVAFECAFFDTAAALYNLRSDVNPELEAEAAIASGVAELFLKFTLAICERWANRGSESSSRNALDIVSSVWMTWACLKLPKSEDAIQNLAKAAKLILLAESIRRAKEWKPREMPGRVPAPCKAIVEFLNLWYWDDRFNFERVADRYRKLGSDNESLHPLISVPIRDNTSSPNDGHTIHVEDGSGVVRGEEVCGNNDSFSPVIP